MKGLLELYIYKNIDYKSLLVHEMGPEGGEELKLKLNATKLRGKLENFICTRQLSSVCTLGLDKME